MTPPVLPEVDLGDGDVVALLALEGLDLALAVHPGGAHLGLLKVLGAEVVLVTKVFAVLHLVLRISRYIKENKNNHFGQCPYSEDDLADEWNILNCFAKSG